MKHIIPVLAVLALGGCTATSPQYTAQRQAEILTNAEAACSQVNTPEKNLACLNRAVHQSGYWGEGVKVVRAGDGSPQIVENYHRKSPGFVDGVGVSGTL